MAQLVDMYGDVVCELEKDFGSYYRLPKDCWLLLAVGDVYEVVGDEDEED